MWSIEATACTILSSLVFTAAQIPHICILWSGPAFTRAALVRLSVHAGRPATGKRTSKVVVFRVKQSAVTVAFVGLSHSGNQIALYLGTWKKESSVTLAVRIERMALGEGGMHSSAPPNANFCGDVVRLLWIRERVSKKADASAFAQDCQEFQTKQIVEDLILHQVLR